MKIVFKESFVLRFGKQIEYIANDSPSRAKKFKNDLMKRIQKIPSNPYLFRKSIYFNNEEIRDLIFKGYTIVFRIGDDVIEVFGFVKHQNSPTD